MAKPSTLNLALMDATTSSLPSRVEETLAACPRFRIVVVGNTGVGKSSLVSSIFNISLKDIDIAHDRAGRADITHEYTSEQNQRFVLHDSQGFEAGSMDNWHTAEIFLRDRNRKQLQDRVHAIWLCIESPREGARVKQTGDERLLSLAQELKIPVIVVFTKYDILLKEQEFLEEMENGVGSSNPADLERKMETCFDKRIKDFKESTECAIVKVSTDPNYPQRTNTLRNLTAVTGRCLGATEDEFVPSEAKEGEVPPSSETRRREKSAGSDAKEGVLVAWVTAQRMSARQKVEVSISEGFKKYWSNLAKSSFFQGHTLKQCVWRIHDDILKVWNFNDPDKLLSNKAFFDKILLLVEPLLEGHEAEVDDQSGDLLSKGMSTLAPLATTGFSGSPHLIGVSVGIGLGVLTIKFLFGAYKKISLTAQYLAAYIIDLICILHLLFTETLRLEPPRALSEELISKVVESYKKRDSWRVHQSVSAKTFPNNMDDKIRELIYEYTASATDDPLQSTYAPEDTYGAPADDHGVKLHASGSRSGTPRRAKREKGHRSKSDQCIIA